jgi:ADP-heptose:LPS heptosyltransferase
MLAQLLARFRQLRRRHKRQRLAASLAAADAAALAGQAAPNPTRVLVLRNDSIGDYLLFRPWLRALSQVVHARGQRLTLAANALWAPLARAWDADLVEELLVIDFGRFTADVAYRTGILQGIGAAGYGEVIYPLHVREPAAENFVRFMRAPVRVASHGEHQADEWFQTLDAGYTHLLPTASQTLFEYDRNGEFFTNWLAATMPASEPNHLATDDARSLNHRPALALPAAVLAMSPESAAAPYLVLFPGASARQKRWPTRHFARLAQGLHQRYGSRYRLVLAGSPTDTEYARQIQRAAGPAVPLENHCGQTDLPGLASLVAGATLLISNDTVAAHLAAQAGTPCLVLLMGENYGKFFPYPPASLRAPCQCLFPPSQEARFADGDFSPPAHDPAIGKIAPGRVLAAAVALLG